MNLCQRSEEAKKTLENTGHPPERDKLINYMDVNTMSIHLNLIKLLKKVCPDYTHNNIRIENKE